MNHLSWAIALGITALALAACVPEPPPACAESQEFATVEGCFRYSAELFAESGSLGWTTHVCNVCDTKQELQFLVAASENVSYRRLVNEPVFTQEPLVYGLSRAGGMVLTCPLGSDDGSSESGSRERASVAIPPGGGFSQSRWYNANGPRDDCDDGSPCPPIERVEFHWSYPEVTLEPAREVCADVLRDGSLPELDGVVVSVPVTEEIASDVDGTYPFGPADNTP